MSDTLVLARKALESLWGVADLKGRCWGPKREGNAFALSNITLAAGDEMVTISKNSKGELVIHEFERVGGTILGKRIRDSLGGLPIAK